MKTYTAEECKQAYIDGYESGHNDTVESMYGSSEDKANEWIEENVQVDSDKMSKACADQMKDWLDNNTHEADIIQTEWVERTQLIRIIDSLTEQEEK